MTLVVLLLALVQTFSPANEPAWSKEAVVRNGRQPVVRFQARIDNDYLIVRAIHQERWHTYAIDNEARAEKALQGKMSLGIELGIGIEFKSGLKADGEWLQTSPLDLSRPEMRWYTYGFSQTAVFARRVTVLESEPIVLRIRGQACDGETCCAVDAVLEVELPTADLGQSPDDDARLRKMLNDLVPVIRVPAMPPQPHPADSP